MQAKVVVRNWNTGGSVNVHEPVTLVKSGGLLGGAGTYEADGVQFTAHDVLSIKLEWKVAR